MAACSISRFLVLKYVMKVSYVFDLGPGGSVSATRSSDVPYAISLYILQPRTDLEFLFCMVDFPKDSSGKCKKRGCLKPSVWWK